MIEDMLKPKEFEPSAALSAFAFMFGMVITHLILLDAKTNDNTPSTFLETFKANVAAGNLTAEAKEICGIILLSAEMSWKAAIESHARNSN